ncbi:MAG TPA: hypothetical protein V6D18_19375 [Thermosynechococcaceae cyanobacterium]
METHPLPPAPPNFTQPSVGKGSPLKSLPAPLRLVIRPILFAALGIHALLLFTPFPTEQKPKPPEDKKNPVKITQVPTVKPIKTTPTTQTQKASNPSQPKINRSESSVSLPQSAKRQEESAKPQEESAPVREQTPVRESPSSGDVKDPFQGFPHFQPSTPDCFNKGLSDSCRTSNSAIVTVTAFYKTELPKQKFTIELVEEGSSKQIFQVSKEGKARYLHLFEDTPTTVILLSDTKIPDLETLRGAIVPPEDFINLIGSAIPEGGRGEGEPATTAQYEQFEKPQFFYKPISDEELKRGTIPEFFSGIDGTPKVAIGTAPEQLYKTHFESDLRTIFKEVKDEGQYGGGSLYKLKSDKVTIFLNLVPFSGLGGKKGTIVVTWLRDPRS